MNTLIDTEKDVPLGPLTTLAVGGHARQLLRITSHAQAHDVVNWWRALPESERPPLLPLGGGSNLLVSDAGFGGLVLKLENKEFETVSQSDREAIVRVGAGVVWDDFVAEATQRQWAGVECLSGIPGCVGASPVQNIGAYGQDVSESIVKVEGIRTDSGEPFVFSGEECDFSYRDSFFKRAPCGRYLITSVTFRLRPNGAPTVRYGDLQQRCRSGEVKHLSELRALVLEIRRSKSMVYDPVDPNHRSAGSFFTNPIVTQAEADRIAADLGEDTTFPRFRVTEGYEKLSAAWLIDRSGLKKGFRLAPSSRAALSTNHVLALTNRGGGSAQDILDLCRHVQQVVKRRFSVDLVPEPVFVGFDST